MLQTTMKVIFFDKQGTSIADWPGYDATRVTEIFGGGGHKGAAGASLKLPIGEAVKAVEKAMLELK